MVWNICGKCEYRSCLLIGLRFANSPVKTKFVPVFCNIFDPGVGSGRNTGGGGLGGHSPPKTTSGIPKDIKSEAPGGYYVRYYVTIPPLGKISEFNTGLGPPKSVSVIRPLGVGPNY